METGEGCIYDHSASRYLTFLMLLEIPWAKVIGLKFVPYRFEISITKYMQGSKNIDKKQNLKNPKGVHAQCEDLFKVWGCSPYILS